VSLLDTDILVDFFQGRSDVVRIVNGLTDRGDAAISAVTLGEVLEGILFGRDPSSAEDRFGQWLQVVTVLPVDEAVARHFAQIRGDLRRVGMLIPDADLLIAATALHHDLTLVTRNRRHFARVPGIRLYPA